MRHEALYVFSRYLLDPGEPVVNSQVIREAVDGRRVDIEGGRGGPLSSKGPEPGVTSLSQAEGKSCPLGKALYIH